eukprot:934223-Heterocapsa_arctica.AAC.1
MADRYDSRFWNQGQKQWRLWATEACNKGGKAAHRWTKPLTKQIFGKKASTVQERVNETLVDWQKIWGDELVSEDWSTMEVGEPLPRLTPSQLRRAACSIKQDTALSGDFLHPRTIALLDDQALEDLAELFLVMEESGKPPIELLTLVFIPKPDGSTRPIGLLTGLMRLWGKARRSFAWDWELANARPYFWAGKGKPAARSVHRQSLRAEVARSRGQASASTLLDMVKCYEKI